MDYIYSDIGVTNKASNYIVLQLESGYTGTVTITNQTNDYVVANTGNKSKALLINNLSLSSFTMEADFSPQQESIGLALCTAEKYGHVYAVPASRDQMNGWQYKNGAFSAPLGYSQNFSKSLSDYNVHLKVVKNGSTVTVDVYDNTDNTRVYTKSITLPDFLQGSVGVGVGVGVGSGNFKNFTIL